MNTTGGKGKTLTKRIRQHTTEQRAVLSTGTGLRAVPCRPTYKAKTQCPVKVLVGWRQLEEVVEGRAIDLDGTSTTIEGGRLEESNLVEGMGRHDDLLKATQQTTSFYTLLAKGSL